MNANQIISLAENYSGSEDAKSQVVGSIIQ